MYLLGKIYMCVKWRALFGHWQGLRDEINVKNVNNLNCTWNILSKNNLNVGNKESFL